MSKGQHQWYENIYDISSPQDWNQQESLSHQPENVTETGPSKVVFDHPSMYDYNDQSGNDYMPDYKWLYRYREHDPEDDAQFPNLSQDSAEPNKPNREDRFDGEYKTKHSYLADVSPDSPNHDKDDVGEQESDIELENYKAYPEKAVVPTLPDPTIEVRANAILAEYNLEHGGYIELDPWAQNKVAWTLDELVKATSNFSVKNEPRCQASFRRVQKKLNRYAIHVVCGESWSNPTGHVVRLKFEKTKNIKQAPKSNIRVSCSCPFWRYYGCDWNASNKDYLNAPGTSNGAAPAQRGRDHLICKHVAASLPLIKYLIVRKP